MKNEKYELTDETMIAPGGVVLHRIRSLKNFSDVKAGELGGFVESENNLFDVGRSWIYDNSAVYGTSVVRGDSQVYGNSIVKNSLVMGNTFVIESVVEESEVRNHAVVRECNIKNCEIINTADLEGVCMYGGKAR